jgi:hypothetical protein
MKVPKHIRGAFNDMLYGEYEEWEKSYSAEHEEHKYGDVPADPDHHFFSAWQFCQWFDALPDEDDDDEPGTGPAPTLADTSS